MSGSRQTRLITDPQSLDHSGTFEGKLSWNGSSFDSDLTLDLLIEGL